MSNYPHLSAESENTIQLKTGIFSRKVLAGCVWLNSRMRAKFVLRDIRFMILNLKDNFADYNVISNLLVSLSNLTCSSQ
jgi:hypothetical protein